MSDVLHTTEAAVSRPSGSVTRNRPWWMSSAGLWPAALAQWTSRPGATVTNAGHAFLVTGRPPASSPSVRPDLGRGSQAPLRPTVRLRVDCGLSPGRASPGEQEPDGLQEAGHGRGARCRLRLRVVVVGHGCSRVQLAWTVKGTVMTSPSASRNCAHS